MKFLWLKKLLQTLRAPLCLRVFVAKKGIGSELLRDNARPYNANSILATKTRRHKGARRCLQNLILTSFISLCFFINILQADIIFKKGGIKGNSNGSNGANFDVNNDGVNDLVMDPSGNVGLGVTSPSANLHVAGNLNLSGNIVGGLNKGLVGWWSFDGGSVADHSGYGHDGTIGNGPTTVTGKFSNALSFDNTDDYVTVSETAALEPNTYSIVLWVKKNSEPAAFDTIIEKIEWTPPKTGWVVLFNADSPSKPYFANLNDSATEYNTSLLQTSLAVGIWRHLAYTFDGTIITAYEDGVKMGTKTFSGNLTFNDNGIHMAKHEGVANYSPITLDDVRFYNRALLASEVNELYRAKSSYFSQGGIISGNTTFSGNVSVSTLNLGTSSAPASPQTGDLYSTGTNLLYRNSAGVWVSVIDTTDDVWTQSSGNLSYDDGNIGVGSLSGAEFTVDNQSSGDNILDFYDNTTLALTVQDGGFMGIGNAAPSYKLDVAGNVAISSDLTLSSDLTMGGHILPSANNTYHVGSTTYAWRGIYSKDFLMLSDRRRKQGIKAMGSAQDILKRIRPVDYHWKSNPGEKEIGLIAQEVSKVLPQAVLKPKEKDGLMAVKYQALIPVMIQVEKEQAQEIERRLKDFKASLKELDDLGEELE